MVPGKSVGAVGTNDSYHSGGRTMQGGRVESADDFGRRIQQTILAGDLSKPTGSEAVPGTDKITLEGTRVVWTGTGLDFLA
jgi:hypothetical protein